MDIFALEKLKLHAKRVWRQNSLLYWTGGEEMPVGSVYIGEGERVVESSWVCCIQAFDNHALDAQVGRISVVEIGSLLTWSVLFWYLWTVENTDI